MKAAGWGLLVMAAGVLMPAAGCCVPKSELVNYETTNRVLAEQNRRNSRRSRISRSIPVRPRIN